MKKFFYNNVGAESFSARLDGVHYSDRAEKDSAPTIRKRSPRRDDSNKSSLLRTPSSSLPIYSVGFTLIELLAVVLIIAILAAVALPQYTKAVEKSRATEALLNLKALSDASARYYLQNDSYTGMTKDSLDVTVTDNNKFTYSVGGGNIYAANHMDLVATRAGNKYMLVGVHVDGNRRRTYCKTASMPEICNAMGATSCAVNTECLLP
ncbi:prepilin-type N-terminal cleavage/methylation domain-containing protein [Parelusimicrobium proximum]|uniref:type IV pilin protein n=1 Tax=Parelusimicrobium proximum TaxID=3228953 RepID=UPI003D1823B8